MITGKCLCEEIEYQINGELGPIFNCHCSKCRRWHGAVYRTRASIHVDQFSITKGEKHLSSYQSSKNVTKYFCRNCGSPLHSSYLNKADVYGIPLGPLEGVKGQIEGHIFVDSKADWFEINDGLAEYPSWPGAESKVRETRD